MIRIVNAVTVLQRSQRCRGTEWWREEDVCPRPIVHSHSSSSPPHLPSLSLLPSRSLVKDSSPGKLNQTAWIKAIIQFVYKASFILCQASAPLTVGGSLTPDLCWGLMMHLLHCSTRVFQAIIRRQGAKDAWWESYYSNLCITVTECTNPMTLSIDRVDHVDGAWTVACNEYSFEDGNYNSYYHFYYCLVSDNVNVLWLSPFSYLSKTFKSRLLFRSLICPLCDDVSVSLQCDFIPEETRCCVSGSWKKKGTITY